MTHEPLDIVQELSKSFEKIRTDFDAGAYRLEDETPAHTFTSIVATIQGGTYFINVTARDAFDESLARALIAFVRSHETQIDPSKPGQILEGFRHEGYAFDSVLIVSPAGHETFKTESPAMYPRTLLALPIYRCEFSGSEDGELIKLIRREFIVTIDWKRAPSPQIWMRYKNLRTKSASRGRKLGLALPDVLRHELQELPNSPGSFVEVKNFKGEQLKVVSEDKLLVLESSLMPVSVRVPAEAPVTSWIEVFVCKGFAQFKEVLPR